SDTDMDGASAGGAGGARLRSTPSSLSGSCQRREPPMASVRRRITGKPVVVVVGAGVAGLGLGWRLAQRGADVSLFDRSTAGSGARSAAAGMLATCAEGEPGEETLLRLGRLSQSVWPGFCAGLPHG